MGYSKLVTSKVLTGNHSGARNHAIDTITPHYMCWYVDGETCARSFVPPSRMASSNYCIGRYGDIVLNVDEDDRAWTSGSGANDNRAITIECANYMESADGHTWGQLPDATWESLVALCADICRRHGFKGVRYVGSADYSKLDDGYMLLTKHCWFQDTDCPGPWLSGQFDRLASEVNARMSPQAPGDARNDLGLRYRAHVQRHGWLPSVHDGQTAGVTGRSLRMEALKVTPPEGVEMAFEVHMQGKGWVTYEGVRKGRSSGTGSSGNDPIMGTVGEGRRIEAVRARVTKMPKYLEGRHLVMQAHVRDRGWLGPVGEGEICGTVGEGRRMEAIRLWFE